MNYKEVVEDLKASDDRKDQELIGILDSIKEKSSLFGEAEDPFKMAQEDFFMPDISLSSAEKRAVNSILREASDGSYIYSDVGSKTGSSSDGTGGASFVYSQSDEGCGTERDEAMSNIHAVKIGGNFYDSDESYSDGESEEGSYSGSDEVNIGSNGANTAENESNRGENKSDEDTNYYSGSDEANVGLKSGESDGKVRISDEDANNEVTKIGIRKDYSDDDGCGNSTHVEKMDAIDPQKIFKIDVTKGSDGQLNIFKHDVESIEAKQLFKVHHDTAMQDLSDKGKGPLKYVATLRAYVESASESDEGETQILEVKSVPTKISVRRFYGNKVTLRMAKDRNRYRMAILKKYIAKDRAKKMSKNFDCSSLASDTSTNASSTDVSIISNTTFNSDEDGEEQKRDGEKSDGEQEKQGQKSNGKGEKKKRDEEQDKEDTEPSENGHEQKSNRISEEQKRDGGKSDGEQEKQGQKSNGKSEKQKRDGEQDNEDTEPSVGSMWSEGPSATDSVKTSTETISSSTDHKGNLDTGYGTEAAKKVNKRKKAKEGSKAKRDVVKKKNKFKNNKRRAGVLSSGVDGDCDDNYNGDEDRDSCL